MPPDRLTIERPAAAAPATPAAAVRLAYLDGVRGWAVAVVVLHHLYLRLVADPAGRVAATVDVRVATGLGRAAVDAFLVLSGYSLMLPVARSVHGCLVGGVGRYLRRRAWRTLPPYYAAVALSIVPLVPGLVGWPRLPWRSAAAAPAVTAGGLLSHLVMAHNLRPTWAYQINGPLWTLATEWQIYLLFPAVLLPLWRRIGGAPTAVLAMAAGVSVAHGPWPLDQASPWYVGLFAAGMTAATGRPTRTAWTVLALAAAVCVGVLASPTWTFDAACGLAAALFLSGRTDGPWPLTWRPAVGLGVVSYSLYLTHQPLITVADTLLAWRRVPTAARWAALPAVSLPAVAVVALAFHRAVERPCMPGRPTTARRAAITAAVEPGV